MPIERQDACGRKETASRRGQKFVQLKLLMSGLASEGFQVVVARDAVQAVAMARKELPDLRAARTSVCQVGTATSSCSVCERCPPS